MDLFRLKTDGEKFTSTNEKTLHLIFNTVQAIIDETRLTTCYFIL